MQDLTVNPNNLNHIFVAGYDSSAAMALFKSLDAGSNWTTHRVGPTNSVGYSVAIDPGNDNMIYLGGAKNSSQAALFKSLNGGSSWAEITGSITGSIQCAVVDPTAPQRVYVGTSNGFFKSENAGASWTKKSDKPVTCIKINTSDPKEVFFGGSSGVFRSLDYGNTWADFNSGLGVTNIFCLAFNATNKILYAGTYYGGIYQNSQLGTFTLTISAGAGGTTNPAPGTYTYPAGTNVTVTAVPNATYAFSGWSGDASGTTNPITITLNSNKSITANFLKMCSLVINAGTGGTTNPAPGTHLYSAGTNVTVTAIPNAHFTFANWSGDASGTANPITVVLNSDKSVTANFLRAIYAPQNFTGVKKVDRSIFLARYINVLTWQANADNANIEKYRIYLIDGESPSLLAEVASTVFEYKHLDVEKNTAYSYVCVAVNNQGREGDRATVTVR